MNWLRKYKGEELAEGESLMVDWDSITERNQVAINFAEEAGDAEKVAKLERPHTWVVTK